LRTYPAVGVQTPRFLLPCPDIDRRKWAVVACDQYTSQPEYWQQVESLVGDTPSTLHLIFPEVYLEETGADQRIAQIQTSMEDYLLRGLLEPYEGMVLVERTVSGRTRRGLVLCLDLECYDFCKGSRSLIRATEGTILERLPPRVKIRQGAVLELPHILVLIDDPLHTVIEPVGAVKEKLAALYDFDLMMDGGHLTGYLVDDLKVERSVIQALERLAQPQSRAVKHGDSSRDDVLLFAMGDGNHSLATAKTIWEEIRLQVSPDHPARYALVEVENIHDEALVFEPIHRVLFGVTQNLIAEMQAYFGEGLIVERLKGKDAVREMMQQVDQHQDSIHAFGLIQPEGSSVIRISQPAFHLPVGTLQAFLDHFLLRKGAERVDYVHGADVVGRLGEKAGNAGFYLSGMEKSDLFKTVILDGALPRKTFSMGEAHEKRFYMECRKIT
jgi:hypothetical protein